MLKQILAEASEIVEYEVKLTSGAILPVVAKREIMTLGAENVADLMGTPSVILGLFSPQTILGFQLAGAKKEDLEKIIDGWREAVGLPEKWLELLTVVFRRMELVECDFTRFYGVNIADWLGGEISTRRTLTLLYGLRFTRESQFWAEFTPYYPMSAETFVLAQIWGSLVNKPHSLLTAKQDAENQHQADEKRARMLKRGLSA